MPETFRVVGVSTYQGQTKVRFANDLAARFKILNKGGHTDIELIELDEPMSKADAVQYIKSTALYQDRRFAEAIDLANEKYNGDLRVRLGSNQPRAISMEDLKARAKNARHAEAHN